MRYQKGEKTMLNTIKALYQGEIIPKEECENLMCEAEGIEEHTESLLARLKKSLTKDQSELFQAYIAAEAELIEAQKENYFAIGFRLGTRLAAECYSDEKWLS